MVEEERERKGESPEGDELSMFLELPSAAGSYPSFSPPVLGMSQEGSVASWGHRGGWGWPGGSHHIPHCFVLLTCWVLHLAATAPLREGEEKFISPDLLPPKLTSALWDKFY